MKFCLFLTVLVFGLLGCAKEYSYEGGPIVPVKHDSIATVDTIIGDTAFFYDITINGKRELGILGQNAIAFVGGGGDSIGRMYTYSFYNQTGSDPTLVFSKGMVLYHAPSDTSAAALNQRIVKEFLPGFHPFTKDPHLVKGVVLERYDAADKRWSTLLGSADQSGSTFQITKEFNLDPAFSTTGITHSIYVRARFSCTLYDANGNKVSLANGELGIAIWL